MNPAETLLALQARHQKLLQEHAVLEAREAEKAQRRAELRTQLQAAGVNPDEPEQERARLEAEITRILTENAASLDKFEAELNAARAAQPLPTEDVNQPSKQSEPKARSEPEPVREPNAKSEPSDGRALAPVSEPPSRRAPTGESEPTPTFATDDIELA